MQIKSRDQIDNKIINLLLDNGRMSYSEIGQIVGVSRTSVKNRIQELEEDGVISGYKAVINLSKPSEAVTFLMEIEIVAEHFDAAKQKLINAKETTSVIQTTGDCRLFLVCVVSSIQEMNAFINGVREGLSGVVLINAHAVLEELKGSLTEI